MAVGEDPFRGRISNLGLMADAVNPGIFETLTRLTPSFGLAGGLATSWEAETPSRWRFDLRPGVRFHDGTPLTAAAVVDTLRSIAAGVEDGELENVSRRQSLPRGLAPDSDAADGELVVRVELSEPNLRLAEQPSNPSMAVAAMGSGSEGEALASEAPVGTGPFRFVSYDPGAELKVGGCPEFRGTWVAAR